MLQQQLHGQVFRVLTTVSVSVLQDIKIKHLGVRVLHGLRWKCNCSCVLIKLKNKSSKFYKISAVLYIIMLKILYVMFFVDTMYISFHFATYNTMLVINCVIGMFNLRMSTGIRVSNLLPNPG